MAVHAPPRLLFSTSAVAEAYGFLGPQHAGKVNNASLGWCLHRSSFYLSVLRIINACYKMSGVGLRWHSN